jgi:hypothetical protein
MRHGLANESRLAVPSPGNQWQIMSAYVVIDPTPEEP